jgi:hypothetical protein
MRWIWLLMTFMVSSRPKQRTGHFKLFRCSNDFITQKVYFSRLMPVCIGLIMLAALAFPLITVWCNSALIKVDRLAACIALRVVGTVLVVCGIGEKFAQSSSQ